MKQIRNVELVAVLAIMAVLTFVLRRNPYSSIQTADKNIERLTMKRLLTSKDIMEMPFKLEDADIPTIFIVTPTYKRLTQLADMTRLANTLRHVKQIHWIVIEDGNKTRDVIEDLLINSRISYTYMHASRYTHISTRLKGLHQRNLGLHWIRKNVNHNVTKGVLYFADDDNTYDVRLFDEMRYTKKLSVWPVGFVSRMKYQLPVVKQGKVVGFESWNTANRVFPLDMAGFALNINVLFDYPTMYFLPDFYVGYQETQFLELCCKFHELEPVATDYSQILVWHTRTNKPEIRYENSLDLTV